MKRLLLENWGYKLLSLALAILLYVFVRADTRVHRVHREPPAALQQP